MQKQIALVNQIWGVPEKIVLEKCQVNVLKKTNKNIIKISIILTMRWDGANYSSNIYLFTALLISEQP